MVFGSFCRVPPRAHADRKRKSEPGIRRKWTRTVIGCQAGFEALGKEGCFELLGRGTIGRAALTLGSIPACSPGNPKVGSELGTRTCQVGSPAWQNASCSRRASWRSPPSPATGSTRCSRSTAGHVWPLYDGARSPRRPRRRHPARAIGDLGCRGMGQADPWAGRSRTDRSRESPTASSTITSAYFNGAPVVVIGGRAPQARWGSGWLQELDHVPIVATVTKTASTAIDPADTARGSNRQCSPP